MRERERYIEHSVTPIELLQDSRPFIMITEDQVEERQLMGKDGHMQLHHEASKYSPYLKSLQTNTTCDTLQSQKDIQPRIQFSSDSAAIFSSSIGYKGIESDKATSPQRTTPAPTGSPGMIQGHTTIMRERAERVARRGSILSPPHIGVHGCVSISNQVTIPKLLPPPRRA
jgi:hypothetical protein